LKRPPVHARASLIALPNVLRRRKLGDTELGKRIHHAIGDAGRAADSYGLSLVLIVQDFLLNKFARRVARRSATG
jgi:hypothetical protein